MRKADVRTLAAAEGLRPAAKRSSAGICFIGRRPFGDFIEQYVPPAPGRFVCASTGADLGPCANLHALTPGQRAPLGGGAGRRYIAGKDLGARVAWVAPARDDASLLSRSALLLPARWVGGPGGGSGVDRGRVDAEGWRLPGLACTVQARYRQADVAAVVQAAPDGWRPAGCSGGGGPDGTPDGGRRGGGGGGGPDGGGACTGPAFNPSRFMACALKAAVSAYLPLPAAGGHDAGAPPTPAAAGGAPAAGAAGVLPEGPVGAGPFLKMTLRSPLRGLAPGQAVVMYDGPVVLGSALLAAAGPTLAEGG
jgi:hypothetical protein